MYFLIRQVTPFDLDAVSNLEKACFPEAEAASREAFSHRIAHFPERFLVAELENHKIIGLINGCCSPKPLLDDTLYEADCPHSVDNPWQTVLGLAVSPSYQHNGIAHALMQSLVDIAKAGGQVGIILTCKKEKIGLYESMGFRSLGVSDSQHGGAHWFNMQRLLQITEKAKS